MKRMVERAANWSGPLTTTAPGDDATGVSDPTYTAHFSLPRDDHNATAMGGRVYGVATLVRDDDPTTDDANWLIHTRAADWDLEGRVLVSEMRHTPAGSGVLAIAIINGYWVNGTSNPYREPATGKVTGTRHDQKLWFHRKMLDESHALLDQGYHVLLVGDMNVAPTRIDGHPNLRTSPDQHVRNREDFNQKLFTGAQGFRGIDVFRRMHGERRKYTYHARGRAWASSCDRVDLIIVDRGLERALVATDICGSPEERGHSDHVPLWVTLDLAKVSMLNGSAPETNTRQADTDGTDHTGSGTHA